MVRFLIFFSYFFQGIFFISIISKFFWWHFSSFFRKKSIVTLSKLFLTKVKTEATVEETDKAKFKTETKNLVNKVYSIIDKAVKKGVIHKNTAARKKSRIGKLFVKIAA